MGRDDDGGGGSLRYDVFLSYSHAADRGRAARLQRGLQRLGARERRRRAGLAVFRDDANLVASPGVWRSIRAAMDASRWLVLLICPESAASEAVGREIEHWRKTGKSERILLVWTGGRWAWDDDAGDFDRAASTAIHPALYGTFAEEPRVADMTWADSGRDLSLRDGRFVDLVAELVAPIREVPREELAGEEVRYQRRTRRLRSIAIGVIVLLAVVSTASSALLAVNLADERQRVDQAERDALAQVLLTQAEAARSGDRDRALQLALAAHELSPGARSAAVDNLAATLGTPGSLGGTDAFIEIGEATALAFSPDGDTLVAVGGRTRGAGTSLDAWDVRDPARPRLVGEDRTVGALVGSAAAFSPDGDQVATVGADGLQLWDVADRTRPTTSFRPEGSGLASVAWMPDGRALVTGSDAGALQRWDVGADGRPRPAGASVAAHPGPVEAVAVAVDGLAVASGSDDGLRLWGLEQKVPSVPLAAFAGEEGDQLAGVRSIAFSPDGDFLAWADAAAVHIVDATDRARPRRVAELTEASAFVSYSSDGRSLTTERANGPPLAWDVVDVVDPTAPRPMGATGVLSTEFLASRVRAASPDGETVALVSTEVGSSAEGESYDAVRLWDVGGRASLRRWTPGVDLAADDGFPRVAAARGGDEALVLTASGVHRVDVADPRTPQVAGPAFGPQGGYADARAVSAQGIVAVVMPPGPGASASSPSVELWDAATDDPPDEPAAVFPAGSGSVVTLAFSPDGHRLVVGSTDAGTPGGGHLSLWDVEDLSRPRLLDREGVNALSATYSPAGDTLAVTVGNTMQLWRSAAEQLTPVRDLLTVGEDRYVAASSFSSDGTMLVAAANPIASGRAGAVYLWDVADPEQPRRAGDIPVSGVVGDLAFSPTAPMLALASFGRTPFPEAGASGDEPGRLLQLWSLADPQRPMLLARPEADNAAVALDLAFNDDGSWLYAAVRGTEEQPARLEVWDLSVVVRFQADAVSIACDEVGGVDLQAWEDLAVDHRYADPCTR